MITPGSIWLQCSILQMEQWGWIKWSNLNAGSLAPWSVFLLLSLTSSLPELDALYFWNFSACHTSCHPLYPSYLVLLSGAQTWNVLLHARPLHAFFLVSKMVSYWKNITRHPVSLYLNTTQKTYLWPHHLKEPPPSSVSTTAPLFIPS